MNMAHLYITDHYSWQKIFKKKIAKSEGEPQIISNLQGQPLPFGKLINQVPVVLLGGKIIKNSKIMNTRRKIKFTMDSL